jgi:cytochrome c553
MRHHFAQVTRMHEALIRGDLSAVLAPAAELATTDPPQAFPEMAVPFVEAIRRSARRAGTAPNLRSAAAETVTLLGQCAACHQAAGMYPSPASPRRPDVGTIVGHMLDHQRAANDMLEGLMMPSASRWLEAADRLETLTLRPEEWPRDSKLTAQARQADAAVHALADRARAADTSRARANVYVDLVTTCASCHSLHRGVWGPRSVQ